MDTLRDDKVTPANKEIIFQENESANLAAELIVANKELSIANKELIFQKKEKKKRGAELNISTLKNLKDRKKDEEYIGRLAAIVESSDDAIISKSLDGVIKSWNKGGEKMFGYTAKEAMGKHISLIIPPEYLFEEKNIAEKVINNEAIRHYETIRTKKNGESFHVAITVSPVKDRSGKIVGLSKIVRDITSSKKSEEDLVKANKMLLVQNEEKEKKAVELEAAIKELESFSYSVSHDLRAPLRAINGFTQIMVEDYLSQLDEEAKIILNEIIRNSHKMGELIDNLLSFSRIGKKPVTLSNINIKELINEVIAELKLEEPNRVFKITIKKLENINGDTNMLRQVFINLISNAFKYTGKKKEAEIEIGSYNEDNNIVYYVKDNGAGFDMRYYDKLFGVFQRLHSSNEFEGTGVGLAIIQKIITKHGGQVWADAKVNEGARFYISLPDSNNQKLIL
jgi:PAS domain S-box-containing protein